MIHVYNDLSREDAALGVVRAYGIAPDRRPPGFDAGLAALLDRRRAPLTEAEDAVRLAARALLRNGGYKPSGRGKPASEYLLRAAQQGTPDGADGPPRFPRINAPVDVCNYVSLASLLPISLWDLDRADADRFRFRLGQAGEVYTFNAGGQAIKLDDLLVGCRIRDAASAADNAGEPIVNPVKDSLATKTTAATRRVAACVYTPLSAVSAEALASVCAEFAAWLAGCGDAVETAYGVVLPGESREV